MPLSTVSPYARVCIHDCQRAHGKDAAIEVDPLCFGERAASQNAVALARLSGFLRPTTNPRLVPPAQGN